MYQISSVSNRFGIKTLWYQIGSVSKLFGIKYVRFGSFFLLIIPL
jgi:hypothetical protein